MTDEQGWAVRALAVPDRDDAGETGAISTQLPPLASLWLLLIQIAALRSCLSMMLVPLHRVADQGGGLGADVTSALSTSYVWLWRA